MTSEAVPIDSTDTTARDTRVRYGVLVLLSLASISAYLTRICISTANTTIQRDLKLDSEQMGVVMAAFFIGYAWFQIPTGWLGLRYGARWTMAALSVATSLCSIWTGLAVGIGQLWWSRVGLGVCQAGLVPCAGRAVLDWFPPAGRGRASSAITSCMSLGAVIAQGLTALLLLPLGWRGVFFAYSAVGVLWAAAFAFYFRDLPAEHPGVNRAERDLIGVSEGGRAGAGAKSDEIPMPERIRRSALLVGSMVRSSSAWMICGQAVFRAFVAAFFLTWFPAFLEKGHGVKLQDTGMLAMAPLAASVFGGIVGGVLVDRLYVKTKSKWISRSGLGAVAMLLTALSQAVATTASSPSGLVMILAAGAFCFALSSPASWAATMDISGRHTQFMFAVGNMAGNLGAMSCATVIGSLIKRIEDTHGDWNTVLWVYVGVSLAGAVSWACLNPNRSAVEDPVRS